MIQSSCIVHDFIHYSTCVCFSKDGSYYSGNTLMRVSSGGDTNVRDEIIVSDEDGDNYFSIKWSRFGNIMLSKWTNGAWYIQ